MVFNSIKIKDVIYYFSLLGSTVGVQEYAKYVVWVCFCQVDSQFCLGTRMETECIFTVAKVFAHLHTRDNNISQDEECRYVEFGH